MNYHLLFEGDRVLSVTNEYVVIERCSGTVDFFSISQLEKMSEDSVLPVITLDYSESISDNNDESFTTEDGVSIINF